MRNIFYKYKSYLVFFIIFSCLIILIYITRPNKNILGSYSASIENLSPAQRKNICLAATKINNKYIFPQKIFSFNSVVGPRTLEIGFVSARSLYEGDTLNSMGGGICVVSSVLYNAVLKSCLGIIERVPHKNIIHSVPHGLDATVWYGINDFKFINNTNSNIKIEAYCSINNLNITIKGNSSICNPKIVVKKELLNPHKIKISTFRIINNFQERLSNDEYTF